MKNLLRNLASLKNSKTIRMGGEIVKDKMEWLLAFVLVYGTITVFLIGTIFTCRGIHSFIVDTLSKLI